MSEGVKITDPDELEACRFINEYYERLGSLAPDTFSRECQHAIIVLSAYLRSKRVPNDR